MMYPIRLCCGTRSGVSESSPFVFYCSAASVLSWGRKEGRKGMFLPEESYFWASGSQLNQWKQMNRSLPFWAGLLAVLPIHFADTLLTGCGVPALEVVLLHLYWYTDN